MKRFFFLILIIPQLWINIFHCDCIQLKFCWEFSWIFHIIAIVPIWINISFYFSSFSFFIIKEDYLDDCWLLFAQSICLQCQNAIIMTRKLQEKQFHFVSFTCKFPFKVNDISNSKLGLFWFFLSLCLLHELSIH